MCVACGVNHAKGKCSARAGELSLRYYQEHSVEYACADLDRHQSSLVVNATGTGKTVIAACIAKKIREQRGGRVMVVAHTEELVRQNKSQFHKWLGVPVDIEMAKEKASRSHWHKSPIVSASWQTLVAGPGCGQCADRVEDSYAIWQCQNPYMTREDWPGVCVECDNCLGGKKRNMMDFDPNEFSLLIIDECHHAAAASYRRIVDWFRRNTKCGVLGITATENRTDGKQLGHVIHCPDVSYRYTLHQGIKDGYLVSPQVYQHVVTSWDLSKCHKGKGKIDYNQKALAKELEREEGCVEVASLIVNHCANLKSLTFAGSVEQAHKIAALVNKHLPGHAMALDGKTPRNMRRQAIDAFKRGDLKSLVNYGILVEGFDEETIQALVNARPTESTPIYHQILGRGTRPLFECVQSGYVEKRLSAIASSSKPHLLVIDCIGQDKRHSQVDMVDAIGPHYPPAVRQKVKKLIKGKRTTVEELDELLRIEQEKHTRQKESRKPTHAARAVTQLIKQIPFDLSKTVAKPSNANREISSKMRAALIRFGVPDQDIEKLTYDHASHLMGTLVMRSRKGLATYKQCKILRSFNDPINVTIWTATQIIKKRLANRIGAI
jgi:superfamily II DNA or RNA helicase